MTRKLREKLVVLYPGAADAQRVMADAGVSPGRVDWSGSAEQFWFAALAEADRLGLIRAVQQVADREYPDVMRGHGALEPLLIQRDARLAGDPAGDVSDLDAAIVRARRAARDGPHLHADEYLGGNRYRLLRPIGRGGFATVWRAYDRIGRRHVAIKVLHGQWAQDASHVERFDRGARAMERLRHPNIIRVEQLRQVENGFHFLVMELAEGGSLRDAVLEGRLTREAALRVVASIGEALAYAHAAGVIHRDVKPANVLLRADGTGALSDFDLASLRGSTGGTGDGALGSLMYAAPELLWQAQTADERADVFGLGMTTVFTLAGREPPAEAYRNPIVYLFTLDCSVGVRRALARALAWQPQHRVATIRQFCELLQAEVASPAALAILVVDDQGNMRRTLAMVLRMNGYDVDEAVGGDEAIEKVSSREYDVVLTDLRMGATDGLAVLRHVKELSPLSEVVIMTSFGSIESAVEAMRLGAYDYLQKPFSEEEILVKVRRAIEKRMLTTQMALLTADAPLPMPSSGPPAHETPRRGNGGPRPSPRRKAKGR